MISPALRSIMDAVDDLVQATDPLIINTIRSSIALNVAKLTGDELQTVFDALRDPPPRALKMGTGHRKPKVETQEQVVEHLVRKLRIVPVRDEVDGGQVPWSDEVAP